MRGSGTHDKGEERVRLLAAAVLEELVQLLGGLDACVHEHDEGSAILTQRAKIGEGEARDAPCSFWPLSISSSRSSNDCGHGVARSALLARRTQEKEKGDAPCPW